MKHTRKSPGRWQAAALALALTLGLAACAAPGGNGQAETSPYTPAQMAEVVLATQPRQPQLYLLQASSSDFAARLRDGYLIDPSGISDGAICYPLGFEAAEVTILRMKNAQAAEQAADALQDYAQAREETFLGYAPAQADLAARGVVARRGNTVALLICDENGAEKAFLSCFGDTPPALPETQRLLPHAALAQQDASNSGGDGEESGPAPESTPDVSNSGSDSGAVPAPGADVYDRAAVLDAWRSGDESALGEKNREILQICREIIQTQITDDMTAYEQELAIHDWLIDWADYDTAAHSFDPRAQAEPDNGNPYGLLVGKRAICSGYAATFQLFMDLLGIECMTVHGEANASREEHAWNLVRLDGEWYCVDVTWDDPAGNAFMDEAYRHQFFNVTSQFLRETRHYWDEDAVPECTAAEHRWQAGQGEFQ